MLQFPKTPWSATACRRFVTAGLKSGRGNEAVAGHRTPKQSEVEHATHLRRCSLE
jgi:hypothetical protein